jgi:site-specific DNA recombinase
MKVVFYVRVSTGRQAEEGVSLDGQVNQLTAWAQREGHEVVEIYRELGVSATDDRRPELQRMMADALQPDHPIDAVAVFSLSRFFRNAYELAGYEKRLRRAKVKLISITQQTGEDEAGQMLRNMLANFDEYQSKENGKNVRRSMVENAQQGFFNGSRAPFGYTAVKTDVKGRSGFKRKLEPNANEAEAVRTIFKLAIAGDAGEPWGIKRIATEMNRRGETYRGKEWTKQMVWTLVTSTTYYGEHVFNRRDSRSGELRDDDDWVVTKIPPIVSKEDWDKAAALRAERAPGGNSEHRAAQSPTLLTGLAKCAHCGAGFVLVSGKGGNYDYYRCGTRAYKASDKCDMPNIPMEELDAAVLNVVAEKILQPARIMAMLEHLREQIAKLQAPDREREKLIQRQMALATEQINTWYALVEEGKTEMHESLRDRLTAAQKRIDQMTSELQEISRRRQLPLKKFGEAQVQGFAEAVRTEVLAPESKFAKGYLRTLVSEIRISAAGATMKGSNADMAGAISGWRPGNPNLAVPRHVSNWRDRQGSNLQRSLRRAA